VEFVHVVIPSLVVNQFNAIMGPGMRNKLGRPTITYLIERILCPCV